MAYLAIRGSAVVNGVSRLHGVVSRRIFQGLFPRWPALELPVGHVTNGVHTPTWDSAQADALWTKACGSERRRGAWRRSSGTSRPSPTSSCGRYGRPCAARSSTTRASAWRGKLLPWAWRRTRWRRGEHVSTPMRSRWASRGVLRPTSAPACCCTIRRGCSVSCPTSSARRGWALGDGREHGDDPAWDAAEAEALYGLIEREALPAFYTRDERGIPTAWIAKMHASMGRLTPRFSANRVVREYTDRYYVPAAARYRERAVDNGAPGLQLVAWRRAIAAHWHEVRFGATRVETRSAAHHFSVIPGRPPCRWQARHRRAACAPSRRR